MNRAVMLLTGAGQIGMAISRRVGYGRYDFESVGLSYAGRGGEMGGEMG